MNSEAVVPVPRMHVFTVPLTSPLPTPNHRISRWTRASWVRRVRQDVCLAVRSEMTRRGIPVARPDEHRCLTMTLLRGPRQRLLDPDNVVATLKPVLDALGPPGLPRVVRGRMVSGGAGAGLIANDDEKHVSVHYAPQQRAAQPGVRIVAGPIEP